MARKLRPGVWGGIVFLAVGVLFFVYSLLYPYKSEIGPGPGFFPLWISGALIILACIYIYEAATGHDSSEDFEKGSLKKILLITLYMVVYVLLLPIAGFNVTSVLFLFVLLLHSYKLVLNLVISIVTTVSLYFLFLLLGVQLPLNALGF